MLARLQARLTAAGYDVARVALAPLPQARPLSLVSWTSRACTVLHGGSALRCLLPARRALLHQSFCARRGPHVKGMCLVQQVEAGEGKAEEVQRQRRSRRALLGWRAHPSGQQRNAALQVRKARYHASDGCKWQNLVKDGMRVSCFPQY